MQSKAVTVEQYLGGLPEDRRETIEAVRKVIRDNLPEGYEEGMQYGMIGYFVPHSLFPDGYHCDPTQPLPFAGLASQKNHMALYLMGMYGDEDETARFQRAWTKTGRKLDMAKACVRFKKLEDVPLEVIGQAVKRLPVNKYVQRYLSVLDSMGRGRSSKPSRSPKKKAPNKAPAKRGAKAKTTSKKTGKKAAPAKSAKGKRKVAGKRRP